MNPLYFFAVWDSKMAAVVACTDSMYAILASN